MNWNTGFWRLWIFLSFLWGIALIAVFFSLGGLNATQHYYYSPSTDELDSSYWKYEEEKDIGAGKSLNVAFPNGITVTFVVNSYDSGKTIWLAPDAGMPKGTVRMAQLSDPSTKAKMLAIAERAARISRQERIKNGAVWITVLVAPPIALLFLGLAVGWVIKGFKDRKAF